MNETLRLILTIVQVVICVALTVSVLFQKGESSGLSGSITGSAETFFGKNGGRSLDAKLGKLTAISAVLFIALTFVLAIF